MLTSKESKVPVGLILMEYSKIPHYQGSLIAGFYEILDESIREYSTTDSNLQ
jgi:peptidase E